VLKTIVAREFVGDFRRFAQYSLGPNSAGTQLRAALTAATHGIEKGLSLASPRPWFGQEAIGRLVDLTREYIDVHGRDHFVARSLGTLKAYLDFHEDQPKRDDRLIGLIEGLLSEHVEACSLDDRYGTIPRTQQEIHEKAKVDWDGFVRTRHSIRAFSDEPVDKALIEEAISMAQMTPSVCNRQTSRVLALSGDVQGVLALQEGSSGFGHQAAYVLAIMTDTTSFFPEERNQRWIDGGMFSMSLVYALHSLGLGTCCLEWTSVREKDDKLREMLPIKDSEVVVVFIAVGQLPEHFSVACSPRLSRDEVLRFWPVESESRQ